MNILQVNFLDNRGGAARIAWTLHQAYPDSGHQAWMVVGSRLSDDDHVFQIGSHIFPEDSILSKLYWPTRDCLKRITGKDLETIVTRINRVRFKFNDLLGHENYFNPITGSIPRIPPSLPDIIHAHNLHDEYFDLRFLHNLSTSHPFLITLHDAWLFSGHCAHSFDCMRWKTGCGACPYLDTPPAIKRDATAHNWRRKKRIYKQSKLYLASPSKWMMDIAKDSIIASAVKKSKVIHNGIDLSIFTPSENRSVRKALDIPSNALVLLFVSLGTKDNVFKDFTTIRDSLEIIDRLWNGDHLIFLALGGEKAISRIGKIDVMFMPYSHDSRIVAQYFQSADVYIHASRADTFPTVILESLACGTPVVATAVGGIPEQIRHGETGFLTISGDAQELANRVIQLLKESSLRKKFSVNAERDAVKRFGHKRMVDEYLDYYQEIIADWESG